MAKWSIFAFPRWPPSASSLPSLSSEHPKSVFPFLLAPDKCVLMQTGRGATKQAAKDNFYWEKFGKRRKFNRNYLGHVMNSFGEGFPNSSNREKFERRSSAKDAERILSRQTKCADIFMSMFSLVKKGRSVVRAANVTKGPYAHPSRRCLGEKE